MWNKIACNSHYEDYLKEKEAKILNELLDKMRD